MRGCGPARCRRRAERKISKKTKTRAARTTRAARKENTMNTLRFDRSSRVSHVTHTRQGPVPAPFLTMRWARRVSAPSRGARPREPRLAPRASRTKPSPPPRPRRRAAGSGARASRLGARPSVHRSHCRGAGARPWRGSRSLGLRLASALALALAAASPRRRRRGASLAWPLPARAHARGREPRRAGQLFQHERLADFLLENCST